MKKCVSEIIPERISEVMARSLSDGAHDWRGL